MITDGEFRRATWHLDFMWGFNGVGHEPTKTGLPFHGEAAMLDDTYLTGKISVDQHPFVEHFKFVKALEDENTVAKQTIPAPAQFLEQFIMPMSLPNTNQYYPDVKNWQRISQMDIRKLFVTCMMRAVETFSWMTVHGECV